MSHVHRIVKSTFVRYDATSHVLTGIARRPQDSYCRIAHARVDTWLADFAKAPHIPIAHEANKGRFYSPWSRDKGNILIGSVVKSQES